MVYFNNFVNMFWLFYQNKNSFPPENGGMADFYNRVKQLARQVRNQSVMEFIISLDINHDSYYSMRRAGNLPRADEAVKIAQGLGVSVEFLVTGQKGSNAKIIECVQNLAFQIIKEISKIE
jgi:hypothetical protein